VRALVERGRLDAEPIGVLQPLMSSSRSGPPYTAAFLSRSSRPDGTTPGLTPSMR
jgi:hypothetical protein